MKKNTSAVAIEKTETSRRGIKTETKAETIMTMSKETTQFVTATTGKQVWFKISAKFNEILYSDGDTTKQSETRAQTGPNRTGQLDVEKRQVNFCLAKYLAGCAVVGFRRCLID